MRMKSFCLIIFFILIINTSVLNAIIFKFNLSGPIDSLSEEYIKEGYNKIKNEPGCDLVIIELDTPGGFSVSMRSIIKEIMNSEVPTAIYVSPKGARAASAGFLITISADIAVMAPGTNMGAAHPVSAMGQKIDKIMNEKVTNDAVSYVKALAKARNRNVELAELAVKKSKSYTAKECLNKGLIDVIAVDLQDLLNKISGIEYVDNKGNNTKLILKDKTVKEIRMTGRQKFLRTITNPNLAYFLLIIGIAGLYIEFTHPGIIIPGVIGGISLLLAFFAFQILPINYIGLMLIILSAGFFIAEVKIQGFGVFGIGGIISFGLGSVILINSPIPEMRPAMITIISVTISFAVIFMGLAYKVFKAMKRGPETGSEGMIGEKGKIIKKTGRNHGKIFIHGEIWKAVSDEDLPSGTIAEVIELNNLVLKVKKTGG